MVTAEEITIHQKLGHYLARLALLFARYPKVTLAGTLLPTIFLFIQCLSLQVDSSLEKYLQDGDPALETYTDFQNRFGSDDRVILGIQTDDVFSTTFFTKLAALQKSIEHEIPFILKSTSILDVPYFAQINGKLLLTSFYDAASSDIADFSSLKSKAHNSAYASSLIGRDNNIALVVLTLSCPSMQDNSDDILAELSGKSITAYTTDNTRICRLNTSQNRQMIDSLQKVTSKFTERSFIISKTGMPLLRDFLRSVMKTDTRKFMILSLLVSGLLLYLLFKSIYGVILPQIVIAASLIATFGTMSLAGVAYQAPMRILPSFLMVVIIGATVHLFVIFSQYKRQGHITIDCVEAAFKHSGLPVLLTCLTTAAGLASFSTASVTPISNLGIFSCVGVLLSLFYIFLLLPPLLVLLPFTTVQDTTQKHSLIKTSICTRISIFAVDKAKIITLFSLILLLIAMTGLTRVQLVHNPLLRLPADAELRKDTETISKSYKGLANIEIVIDTHQTDGISKKEKKEKIISFIRALRQMQINDIAINNVTSLYDLQDEVHTSLFASSPVTNITNEQIKQELFLLENIMVEDLSSYTDLAMRYLRINVTLPWLDAMAYEPLLLSIEQMATVSFDGTVTARLTGIAPLLTRTIHATIESMVVSYCAAALIITLFMIFLLANFRMGLISMFPNLLPIFMTLGLIGWLKIPMDMYALLVGSIAIGLVVDDTIHFMHNFHRYYHLEPDIKQAVLRTFMTSGEAMFITTLVLSGGSLIFLFSAMENLKIFGLLVFITAVFALIADFFLAPALMALYYGKNRT